MGTEGALKEMIAKVVLTVFFLASQGVLVKGDNHSNATVNASNATTEVSNETKVVSDTAKADDHDGHDHDDHEGHDHGETTAAPTTTGPATTDNASQWKIGTFLF